MARYPACVAGCALFAALIGCSGFDSTQLVMHPDTTAASSTFDVALVNIYMLLDTGVTISHKVERDSLHLLVGLPETWDVTEAATIPVRDITIEQMLALKSGSIDATALAALVQQYRPQAAALSPDASLPTAINGKTITAHGKDGKTKVAVNANDVKQWKGFSAPVNIILEKGSKPDTIAPLDSVMAFAASVGLLDDATAGNIAALKQSKLFKFPDSMGIAIVPIAVFLKVKAGIGAGSATLYYFTKTDSMKLPSTSGVPSSSLFSDVSKMDKGDMVTTTVTVVDAVGIRGGRLPFDASALTVVADRATGSVRIDFEKPNSLRTSVDIYSLEGNLVRTITRAAHATTIVWNCAGERGNKVHSGTYLVRIADPAGSLTRKVQIVR